MPLRTTFDLTYPEPADVASPCVNTCRLDTATGWCIGCGRAIGEIENWSSRPFPERRAILAELPARMAALVRSGIALS